MNRYKVSEECIGCRACVEVAKDNFAINENNLAYLKKQPEDENEENLCKEALEVCPVNVISLELDDNRNSISAIIATSNIKATLDKYPKLKEVLINLSPKFKKMQNPALYNTLARFASFNDAAKITGLSVCEILHTMNKFLGVEDKLLKSMPECVRKDEENIYDKSVSIFWEESLERYIYNNDTIEELILKINNLQSQESLIIISVEKPDELLKVIGGLNFKFNVEKNREYRVSIFNPNEKVNNKSWEDSKEKFEILDVRTNDSDPFDVIMKKASSLSDGMGFTLVQNFEPIPIINMLSEMDYEYLTEKNSDDEYRIYFHKKNKSDFRSEKKSEKIDVVIQSATPVAYPIIMKLLQSEKIKNSFNIKELKVWEETEKHLAWITNGKADISFSSLITSAKLKNNDIKIPALFVWDNFVLLSRSKMESFEDIKGKEIYTPLFEEAPPAKISKYLIKASGLNLEDFNFVYGKPFGRPEKIYKDFVEGSADTVVLREPEASYAIKIMEERNEEISVLSFNKIWNDVNPGFGSFPNAGLVLKGEFARQHPEETKVFIEELKKSILWVVENKSEASKLSFEMMKEPKNRVELFLNRVNFEYVDGEKLVEKVKQYFEILDKNEIIQMEIDEDFLNIFSL